MLILLFTDEIYNSLKNEGFVVKNQHSDSDIIAFLQHTYFKVLDVRKDYIKKFIYINFKQNLADLLSVTKNNGQHWELNFPISTPRLLNMIFFIIH